MHERQFRDQAFAVDVKLPRDSSHRGRNGVQASVLERFSGEWTRLLTLYILFSIYKVMEFEWDDQKNRANIAKHGIDFEQAKAVFDDPYLVTRIDDRFEYGEVREVSIGQMPLVTQGQALIVVVVHTERDGITRLISARKATKQERRLYEEGKIFS